MSEELIIGKNPVIEALNSDRKVYSVSILDKLNKQTAEEIYEVAKGNNVTVNRVTKGKLDGLTSGRHQGIVAVVEGYEYSSLERLFKIADERDELPFFIILDEIEDPHNLGAILRTADATGAHGVIIPKRRAVGLTQAVAKASAGAIEHIPVVQVTNIVQTIEKLKEKQVWIVGTGKEGADDYRTLDGETSIAIVIGNEGKGISRLVKESCDWTVSLPMIGEIPSLNASVASSLLMYEIYRKRHPQSE